MSAKNCLNYSIGSGSIDGGDDEEDDDDKSSWNMWELSLSAPHHGLNKNSFSPCSVLFFSVLLPTHSWIVHAATLCQPFCIQVPFSLSFFFLFWNQHIVGLFSWIVLISPPRPFPPPFLSATRCISALISQPQVLFFGEVSSRLRPTLESLASVLTALQKTSMEIKKCKDQKKNTSCSRLIWVD